MQHNQVLGKWGEDQAAQFLARKGFKVIDRNFYSAQGEIDIVAVKGGDFYFIEVKTRAAGEMANDLAITKPKKRKLEKTVKSYCFKRSITEGSFIVAGLLVVVTRQTKQVRFRFAVYC